MRFLGRPARAVVGGWLLGSPFAGGGCWWRPDSGRVLPALALSADAALCDTPENGLETAVVA